MTDTKIPITTADCEHGVYLHWSDDTRNYYCTDCEIHFDPAAPEPVVKESLPPRPPSEEVKTQEYHDQISAKFNELMSIDYPYWW